MQATHDVASLLLDHPRKEGLQSPEVRQGVDGKGPTSRKRYIHATTSYNPLNLSRRQVENELRLHDSRVVDDDGGLADLERFVNDLA